jgi:hypothetical protein
MFQINPLGTQRDGLITDEQGLQNASSDQGDGDPAGMECGHRKRASLLLVGLRPFEFRFRR